MSELPEEVVVEDLREQGWPDAQRMKDLREEALVKLAQDVEICFDEGIGHYHSMRIVNGKLVLVERLGADGRQHYVHVQVTRVLPVDDPIEEEEADAWADGQRSRYGREYWGRA